MHGNALTRSRRRVGLGLTCAIGLGTLWMLTPGLPVVWAPSARAEVRAAGRTLFEHEWTPHDPLAHGDGLGPVFNAQACVSCHFQGGVGGGGGNDHNVTAFEALPTKDRPEIEQGLVHKFAVANRFVEDHASLRRLFPIVPGGVRTEGGCQILISDFDPVTTKSINSTALFGGGWVDRISGKTIVHEWRKRAIAQVGKDLSLDHRGARPGRPRVLPDGRMGKFGWKAQFATLEEFVAAACANEIGLGNPKTEQARPRTKWSYPHIEPDLDSAQFRNLVAFVDTLPRPVERTPDNSQAAERAALGKRLFTSIGCASCHTPDIGGVEGVFSDFLLHRLDDAEHRGGGGYRTVVEAAVPLPEDYPLDDEWKTPPLWGVASSAPYFHDGGSPNLELAILRHHGDAEDVTSAYQAMARDDQQAVLDFLGTLRAPEDALTAPAQLARR
jgi:CxxC motif-containing protein (DUF1111 family)